MVLAKFRSLALLVALATASLLVVVLALQKRDLTERVEGLTTRARDPYPGLYFPAATLPSLSGDSVSLGQAPPGHVQVFFVFSTTCQFCKESLPGWKQIARDLADNSQVELLGISLDSVPATRSYVTEHGIDLTVVSFTDRKLRALYRAWITPQTLIVNAEGRVSYARIGVVRDNAAIDSIMSALPMSIVQPRSRLNQ